MVLLLIVYVDLFEIVVDIGGIVGIVVTEVIVAIVAIGFIDLYF